MAFAGFKFGSGKQATDCHCCNCTYAEDDFTRADETPVASPWSKQSGTDWNLASNQLVAVAAADYTHATPFPGSSSDSRTNAVDWIIVGNGGYEVQTGKSDEDNYFAAALTYVDGDCSILTAGYRLAGTGPFGCTPGPSITGCVQVWGLEIGMRVRIRVCLIPNTGSYGYESYDKVIAVITFPDDATRLPISCTLLADGPAVGAYNGLKTSAAGKWDNFKASYYRDSPSGEHRTCPWCHTGCAISKDDFAYDETCLWDLGTGSYTVSGGKQIMTADGTQLQHHIFHPGLKTTGRFTEKLTDNGVKYQLIGTNGYAELTYSSPTYTLKLFDRDSNLLDTDTFDATVEPDGSQLDAEICYSRGVLSCTITGHDGLSLCVDASTPEVENAFWVGHGGDTGAEFAEFRYYKTYDTTVPSDAACENCAACPAICTDCCDFPTPFGAYLVDLGGGGWTESFPDNPDARCDDYCSTCREIAGEYLVVASSECIWTYGEFACNSLTEPTNCYDFVECFTLTWGIRLNLERDGTGCRWHVHVSIGAGTASPLCFIADYQVDYYSDYLSDDSQCRAMPVTLTKDAPESGTSDTTFPHITLYLCTGNLPDTITIDAVT